MAENTVAHIITNLPNFMAHVPVEKQLERFFNPPPPPTPEEIEESERRERKEREEYELRCRNAMCENIGPQEGYVMGLRHFARKENNGG